MRKVLKSGELDIKNSPIRRVASAASKGYFCFKGLCDGISVTGVGLGFCAGVDGILTNTGRDPLLFPMIARRLEPTLAG